MHFSSVFCVTWKSQDDDEEREDLGVGRPAVPQSPSPPSNRLEVRSLSLPDLDSAYISQHYMQMAQNILTSLLLPCPILSPHNVKLAEEHPIAAGGFANIWKATYAGGEVVLKSYRCYKSFNVTQVITRFCNEITAHSLLSSADAMLVGVYSTETHPLGLVYRYATNLDLRQYLRKEPNVEKLNLLIGIAHDLSRMHDRDIAHGALDMENILVDGDGTPHITGLGGVYIPDRHRVTCIAGGASSNTENATYPTKADDIYAFGVMAFEVLTGRRVFHEMTETAAAYLILTGSRPSRPSRHEVSRILWKIIDGCWRPSSPRRLTISDVVRLLEVELASIPTLGV